MRFDQEAPMQTQSPRKPISVWTAFRTGMRLKTNAANTSRSILGNLFRVAHKPKQLSRALTPIDFVRFREFDFAFKAVNRFLPAPRRILDISSPKLLPLTLASRFENAQVTITDILDREVNWSATAASRLGLSNVTAQVEDARKLTFASESFDLITSISVFEHIAPEVDGEIPAIRELSRVLAPGGIAIITVPFSRKYFADYITGAAYERTGGATEKLFFQRFYDVKLLQQNIIKESRLDLASLGFIDERHFLKNPRKRMSHYVNGSPLQLTLFGPTYPLLSHFFLSQPKPLEACGKPYLACIVLRKPR